MRLDSLAFRSDYPLSAKLFDIFNTPKNYTLKRHTACQMVLEVFAEYEHGTADPEDIAEGMDLHKLYAVYEDLIQTIVE